MGREIRRVPPNWEHPKNERGEYQPMFKTPYAEARQEWIDGFIAWNQHEHDEDYWEAEGCPPDRAYYAPTWEEGSATWWQAYETVSEGTPISPPFATADGLVEYLSTHRDFWGKGPLDRSTAERFVKGGWAPSMIISERGIQSGVEALYGPNGTAP